MAASVSLEPVLVETKLHVPSVRPGFVARDDLVARLVAGRDRKLSLTCAPAGWGKTTILSQWRASPEEERPFAWLSLDPGDDDPVRFWRYVIGALQTLEPGLGASAQAALPNAGPAIIESVLPKLINDLAALGRPAVLVLDDYHVLSSELIHQSVAFFLQHLPQSAQLAIASRLDPPLPLARLRAADELVELRPLDLRFRDIDADALLNGSLALGLEPGDVQLLCARTEGWPAALRLASLSLGDRPDRSAFVRAFAGHVREIGDYLHEVIGGLDPARRDFLLRTSILERLCASLCEAVTGRADAGVLLEGAFRANLFLVALDDRGVWYRYHHLFRDMLRQELMRTEPDLLPELHRRAFAWHRSNGDLDDAISHATAARDHTEATELIARNWLATWQTSPATLARWIDALPGDTVRSDARLCLARGWAALFLGQIQTVEPWIQAAEDCARPGDVLEGLGSVETSSALLRSPLAILLGDVGRAGELARDARRLSESEAYDSRYLADMFVGLTHYYAGDPVAATEPLEEILRELSEETLTQVHVTTLGLLVAIRAEAGDEVAAAALAARAERVIGDYGFDESPTAAIARIGTAKLLELRGDLAGADAALERAATLARRGAWPMDLAYSLALRAGVKRRLREFDAAQELIREARGTLAACPDPGRLTELVSKEENALQLTRGRRTSSVLPPDPQLTEREQVVLRMLATDLSQREIASELYVSFDTVKSQARSIFRKLSVSSRADAVARGRELGLL